MIPEEKFSPDIHEALQKLRQQQDVPAGYFAKLPEQVLAQVKAEPRKTATRWSVWPLLAAASITGLFFLLSRNFSPASSDAEALLSGIEPQVIEAYIDANIDDFSLELLASVNDSPQDMLEGIDPESLDAYLEESLDELDEEHFSDIF